MSKNIGYLVGLGFFLYWLFKSFRRPKVEDVKSIPTGIGPMSYVVIGIMLAGAALILPFSTQILSHEAKLQMNWMPATGFITEHVESSFYKGRQQYRARFHYQTSKETGEVNYESLDPYEDANPMPVGTAIKVLYNPSRPEEAVIDNPWTRWLFSGVLFMVGVFFAFYAGYSALLILRLQSLARLARGGGKAGPGQGTLLKTKKNFFLSQKNRPSWRLIVEYTDLAGRRYVTESEPIWDYNPDTWAKKEVLVPLFLDRSDSSRAWVRVQEYFLACK